MTYKTHTILSALRKIRDEGFTGKINPAMIRELTGIEKPGSYLCDLREKGYLLDAGAIKLKAARGTTIANLYTINPKSDLMPKMKYQVSKHQEKLRETGNSTNSKTSDMRAAIKSYAGEIFTTSQLRKDVDMFKHTSQRLDYLASLGEIKRIGLVKTGGRESMSWQEVKINDALIYKAPVATADAKQSKDPWASVWPEFFMLPKLQGTVRSFAVTDF